MHPVSRKWGLYLGLISLVLSTVLWASGAFNPGDNNIWITIVSIVVNLVVLYLAGTELKKAMNGVLPFGTAFKALFGVTVIAMLFSLAWMAVYTTVLEPDFQQTIVDDSYEKMIEQNPEMSEEQLDMAVSMTEKFTSPLAMVLFTAVFGLLFGALQSLVVALVVRKEEAFPLR